MKKLLRLFPLKLTLLALALHMFAISAHIAASEDPSNASNAVDATRPLAELARKVSLQSGVVVTYEDPRWIHSSQIDDITARFPAAKARVAAGAEQERILVPQAESLLLDPQKANATLHDPGSISEFLRQAVATAKSGSSSQQFKILTDEETVHVIPSFYLGSDGQLMPYESPLDIRINLPTATRGVYETISLVLEEISGASPVQVVAGAMWSISDREQVELGAHGQTAREVLLSALNSGKSSYSWVLFHDPGLDKFFFSVYRVPPSPEPHE